MKYVLSSSLCLFTSITLGSLADPSYLPLFWYSPLCWFPGLYMICSPLPPYDPSPNTPLGYTFLCGHTAFLPNILFSTLLCLWFLSTLTALFYHSSIMQRGLSASASFLLIPPLNPLLNSSMRGYLSYLLSLVIFLNSWIYLSYILSLCSIVLNCSTFLFSSAISPNSFFILLNNSSAISTSNSFFNSSSNRLSFHASAISSCT